MVDFFITILCFSCRSLIRLLVFNIIYAENVLKEDLCLFKELIQLFKPSYFKT